MQNRQSYFKFIVKITYGYYPETIEKQIDSKVDLILASMGATSNIYRYKNQNNLIYLFETNLRKRKGQLEKLAEQHLKTNQNNIYNRNNKSIKN